MQDVTPWPLIVSMFLYAALGWAALWAVHYRLWGARRPRGARQAASGYGESWQSVSRET
jgi:hypothetical protein